MNPRDYWYCFIGVQQREWLRFWQQRTRFASALVRPLLWLVVFAAGFRMALGVSINPPYVTYTTYETYIVPGLCGMIILFNSMQGALSMVYDRELGSMRVLLTSPLPRPFLLLTKLLAMGSVSLVQVYAFLLIARWGVGVRPPLEGYLAVLPALLLASLMLGALGLLIATWVKQLENFAGVMNFVIFPMFFLSSALYPLWRMQEASPWIYRLCQLNPFTHAVETLRFALYLQWNGEAIAITLATTLVLAALAIGGFRPQRTSLLGTRPA
ncbi:MAG: ABC transporter permease [Halomonas sp.]|jgi:ABC-2 type transport system permease protein|uniref:Transport permease protein n=1 Tax=Billgrantia tianxiuensis TaxID=2497861 RepID=A0A6I6SKE6_9GAMM|nr:MULTISPECIES: ABC transporter permease [Halomonas]MCE8034033.1 ABC transporter permease [Halomonas sp. MCCC 1A11057]MDX5434745.1 ABC transporter permease [Halomonas sp.]QHC51109.1 multidrug ABC transporter permease [Halomonas tianxiuensis]